MTHLPFSGATCEPTRYIDRTRDYYLALGYNNPYKWANFRDVPFHKLRQPLAEARLAIITTAAPFHPEKGDQGPTAAYNAAAKFYVPYAGAIATEPDLRISHLTYDRGNTVPNDLAGYFPLRKLKEAESARRIGTVSPRFYGIPTNRSQATTTRYDAPQILEFCRQDEVDAVVLVPNCPICHQVVSLTARHLEANGIATVIIGCAKDIPEFCGVPRFVFTDFPLGNSAGRPGDPASQEVILDLALSLLETAAAPRTTIQSPLVWSSDEAWKRAYCSVEGLSENQIRIRRAEVDAEKAVALRMRQEQIPHLLKQRAGD